MSDTQLKTVLARNVREIRTARKLSQEDLAEKANVSRTYIGMIESELRNASFKMIERIAKALDVEPASLFTIKDRKSKSKSSSSRVRESLRVLFNELVEDALQEIADQE